MKLTKEIVEKCLEMDDKLNYLTEQERQLLITQLPYKEASQVVSNYD